MGQVTDSLDSAEKVFSDLAVLRVHSLPLAGADHLLLNPRQA